MTFPASKTTEVVVSYRHELTQRYSWGIGALYEDLGRHVKDAAKPEELASFKDRFVKHDVHYILRTGRGWDGPIGRCRIEVEFEDGLSLDNVLIGLPRAISGLPPGGKRVPEEKRVTANPKTTKESIVWELRNFEPDRDVAIAYSGTTNKETHQLLEKIHKRDPYDPMIARYLGEFQVNATGDPLERHAINQEILQMWQDRIAIWGPESEDALKLRHSREVFSLMRAVMGAYSKKNGRPETAVCGTSHPKNLPAAGGTDEAGQTGLKHREALPAANSEDAHLVCTKSREVMRWFCGAHKSRSHEGGGPSSLSVLIFVSL